MAATNCHGCPHHGQAPPVADAALAALRDPLLSANEAAELLGLSPATLKKWRRNHRGPRYHRLGSAVRYKREDLEAFVSESAEHPCSPRHNEKGDR